MSVLTKAMMPPRYRRESLWIKSIGAMCVALCWGLFFYCLTA